MSSFKNVLIKGDPVYKEEIAAGAVTPGHLIMLTAAGKAQVHNAAGEKTAALFAKEADMIGNGVDDAYAADDQLFYMANRKGDEVQGLIAIGASVTAGEKGESAGDGTLRVVNSGTSPSPTTDEDAVLVTFRETVDNSAGSAVAKVQAEVL